MFTSDELLSKVIKIVQRCPSIQRIIYFTNGVFNRELYTEVDNLAVPSESATASVAEALTKCPSNLHLHNIVEVERLGAAVIMKDREKRKMGGSTPITGNNNHSSNGYEGLWMPPASERASPSDLAVIMYTSGSTGIICTLFLGDFSVFTYPSILMNYYNFLYSLFVPIEFFSLLFFDYAYKYMDLGNVPTSCLPVF